jgi:hypothetical protein
LIFTTSALIRLSALVVYSGHCFFVLLFGRIKTGLHIMNCVLAAFALFGLYRRVFLTFGFLTLAFLLIGEGRLTSGFVVCGS